MSRPSIWQDRFDRDQDFEVLKPFRASGIDFDRGEPFDKTLVTTRTLRQLYDSRRIIVATNSTPVTISGAKTVQHIGRGRFAVFQDGKRITDIPMTKDEAEAHAAR